MSICPSGAHTGHPGYCQKQTRHFLCFMVDCCLLCPHSWQSQHLRTTSWSPVSDRASSCSAGYTGNGQGSKLEQAPPHLEAVQTSQWHKPHCAHCVRRSQGSHPPAAGIMQISWRKHNCLIPQDLLPKSLGFAPPLWPRNWASSQFTPLNVPYVMALVFVAPTESALKLGLF